MNFSTPILFQIHSNGDQHRAEKTASGGFLLIEAGLWRADKAEAEADLTKMIEAERLIYGDIQPTQRQGPSWP